ncbi:YL1 nuclear protein-domain-containing protein [Mycena alexandri]|uniref:YL1 nuclear protein-domain-containing protein n=1 Tax=Mycena alexandri TaxID=1745969 RepID=A0AAD6SR51_9AGAR|nr:YL1 nuclear protein-domain-containing protein [Mycena alexandri]
MDVDAPLPPEELLLVTRRSRRSNAGNRMAVAMAELEDSLVDEEDGDFTNDKDEEDIFDADFESTDDEAQNEEAAGETAAQEEEKRARKARATRTRLEKATDAAHARNKATFNPQAATVPKPKRRVALGGAVNAATGETIAERPIGHRQSMRKHTVLNTSLTETRLKRSEEKKASQAPRKARPEVRTVSQGELIARALDAEEGNITSHRDYLKIEEEKRRRARVVRPTVTGPLVRWLSRVEEVKVVVPPPPPPTFNYGYTTGSTRLPIHLPRRLPLIPLLHTPHTLPSPTHHIDPIPFPRPHTSHKHSLPPSNAPPYRPNPSVPYIPYTPAPPVMRTEKVARNYVVHEETQVVDVPPPNAGRSSNGRTQGATIPKPSWDATMTAMFGSHVNWEDVTVYAGKNRPMSRPTQTCPLTGRIARYLDPRTWVPFADVGAFETLTRILNHEFVWSPELGAYVRQEVPPPKPAAMEEG